MVDLTKTDEYEDMIVPDRDIETTLKVLRTLRSVYLGGAGGFNAEYAVVLSHAHSAIYEMINDITINHPEAMIPDDIDLLVSALKEHYKRWEFQREQLKIKREAVIESFKSEPIGVRITTSDMIKIQNYYATISKYTSMMYLAQWILNSVNGGLSKRHGTNICNILTEGGGGLSEEFE